MFVWHHLRSGLPVAEDICNLSVVQAAAKPFADSIQSLPAPQLVRMGSCGGGSNVLETFLEQQAGSKAGKKLLKKLRDSYARLAQSPSGCFLVEKAFNVAVSPTACPWSQWCQHTIRSICMSAHKLWLKGTCCSQARVM